MQDQVYTMIVLFHKDEGTDTHKILEQMCLFFDGSFSQNNNDASYFDVKIDRATTIATVQFISLNQPSFPIGARIMISKNEEQYFKMIRFGITLQFKKAICIDEKTGLQLPNRADYMPVTLFTGFDEIGQIIGKYGLSSYITHAKTEAFYASNKDKEIFIVNPYLSRFMIQNPNHEIEEKDLFYKVAESDQEFCFFADYDALPLTFLQGYLRELKVINHSGVRVERSPRKFFINMPIYSIKNNGYERVKFSVNGNDSIYMTKLFTGNNLEEVIIRALKDELKIANDFVRAVVENDLEYDTDRNNSVTPRLRVEVFVRDAHLSFELKDIDNTTKEKILHGKSNEGTKQ